MTVRKSTNAVHVFIIWVYMLKLNYDAPEVGATYDETSESYAKKKGQG